MAGWTSGEGTHGGLALGVTGTLSRSTGAHGVEAAGRTGGVSESLSISVLGESSDMNTGNLETGIMTHSLGGAALLLVNFGTGI